MELSPKQHEVAGLLKAGKSPAAVANSLRIKLSTVRDHIKAIRSFYGTENYQQAIEKATRRGDL